MIFCPHCDKRLTPDHRCAALTRRHFFGLIAGAAAVAAMPKPPVVRESLYGRLTGITEVMYGGSRHSGRSWAMELQRQQAFIAAMHRRQIEPISDRDFRLPIHWESL